MKPSRQTVRHQPDDIGGRSASTRVEREEGTIETDDTAMVDIYPDPSELPPRKHSARYLGTHLKVKNLAEARLLQISEQLSKLADEVRYLNPLVAEAIDDAWEATDDALEMIDIET